MIGLSARSPQLPPDLKFHPRHPRHPTGPADRRHPRASLSRPTRAPNIPLDPLPVRKRTPSNRSERLRPNPTRLRLPNSRLATNWPLP